MVHQTIDGCDTLVRVWCDVILHLQLTNAHWAGVDGCIACPSCGVSHGRAVDAVYPLLYVADRHHDERCLSAAVGLMRWSDHVTCTDGAFLNERVGQPWVGTTTFAVTAIAEALTHHGHVLPEAERERWTNRLHRAAAYIAGYDGWFAMNVNYPIGAATALAAAAVPCGRPEFTSGARAVLDRLRDSVLNDDLLIAGEGMKGRSPRGVGGVDIGYNVEHSLPNLALLAKLLDDRDLLDWTTRSLEAHLQFLLPDGGWDNSWGTRNAKWTYFGSRTTDGAAPALAMLADRDPAFLPALEQILNLLRRCTHDGLLFGGPHVHTAGRQPCVQHTIMHAKGLVAALNRGTSPPEESMPRTTVIQDGVTAFTDQLIWLVRRGPWRATITANDATCPELRESAPTGGALSLLYHDDYGPVFAASMTTYSLAEPLNMPAERNPDVRPLTPRVQAVVDGVLFTQLNDRRALPVIEESDGVTRIAVASTLCDADGTRLPGGDATFAIRYSFSSESMSIAVSADRSRRARWFLPVVCSAGQSIDVADGATVRFAGRGNRRLSLRCEPPSAMWVPPANQRIYNPVPGFLAFEVIVDLREAVVITVSFG